MTLLNIVLRAPILALAALSTVVQAHPGHSHFGRPEEEPSIAFLIWMGFILAIAAYGGWRLFRVISTARQAKKNTGDEGQGQE